MRCALGSGVQPCALPLVGDARPVQAFDIIAARGEQAGDLGEYPGLVVDGDGEHMALARFGGDFHVFTPPPAGGRGQGWSERSELLPVQMPTPLRPGSKLPSLAAPPACGRGYRSEEHTSELQSIMRNSYAVFCL